VGRDTHMGRVALLARVCPKKWPPMAVLRAGKLVLSEARPYVAKIFKGRLVFFSLSATVCVCVPPSHSPVCVCENTAVYCCLCAWVWVAGGNANVFPVILLLRSQSCTAAMLLRLASSRCTLNPLKTRLDGTFLQMFFVVPLRLFCRVSRGLSLAESKTPTTLNCGDGFWDLCRTVTLAALKYVIS